MDDLKGEPNEAFSGGSGWRKGRGQEEGRQGLPQFSLVRGSFRVKKSFSWDWQQEHPPDLDLNIQNKTLLINCS